MWKWQPKLSSFTMLSTEIAYFGKILPLAGLDEQLHPPTGAHSAQSTSNDSAQMILLTQAKI